MDRAKKEELLETCAKKYKEIDVSKKKQMLENRRKKYKEMDASKKKQMLNRKAVKSRKRKISKLHVDVCIMESRIPLGPGQFHVVVRVVFSLQKMDILCHSSLFYPNYGDGKASIPPNSHVTFQTLNEKRMQDNGRFYTKDALSVSKRTTPRCASFVTRDSSSRRIISLVSMY